MKTLHVVDHIVSPGPGRSVTFAGINACTYTGLCGYKSENVTRFVTRAGPEYLDVCDACVLLQFVANAEFDES